MSRIKVSRSDTVFTSPDEGHLLRLSSIHFGVAICLCIICVEILEFHTGLLLSSTKPACL